MGHAVRRFVPGSQPVRALTYLAFLFLCLGVRNPATASECDPSICVGNPCTISGVHLLSDECSLDFTGKEVTVTGTLRSAVDGGIFFISAAKLVLQGTLETLGGGTLEVDVDGDFSVVSVNQSPARINVNASGFLTIITGGSVNLGSNAYISALGTDNLFGGDVIIMAGGDITTTLSSSMVVDGGQGGDGGAAALLADGNITLGGDITANGEGQGASGGFIDIEPGVSGNLTITHRIEAVTRDQGLFDGTIQLGPACGVLISGTLNTRNNHLSNAGGINVVQYSGSADFSSANLLADSNGNQVFCRCPDSNNDLVCDTATCVNGNPPGLAQANPPAVLMPIALAPCGCGNGVVETSLGEECDDGNSDNFDACRYDCKLPRCGDGMQDPNEQCDRGSLNGTSADCCSSTCQFKTSGASCSDASVCTQTDQCNATGSCVGSNPVVCTALDQCHVAGTCNPVSGCSNPIRPNGTTCSDGTLCTQTDTCQNGTCTGTNPVVCTASDQCHVAGTCDPATGACSNPPKANGTVCNDGSACTSGETCQSGTCGSPTSTVTCTALDQCHDVGVCNPATGVCSNPAKPNGTTCNDANACTTSDVCTIGVCGGPCNVGAVCSQSCGSTKYCQSVGGACQCQ